LTSAALLNAGRDGVLREEFKTESNIVLSLQANLRR
jgi:hypothetical protein